MALEVRYICDYCSKKVSNWRTEKGWIRLFATCIQTTEGGLKTDGEYNVRLEPLNDELDFCSVEHMQNYLQYKINRTIRDTKEVKNELPEM